MKILKEGKIPEPPKPWWVGEIHKCSYCSTEVKFENGDPVNISSQRQPNGKHWLTYECPFCKNTEIHQEIIYR